MLSRMAYIVPLFLLLACASPEERARLQTAAAADAWGPTKFADQIDVGSKAFRKARTLLPNASG